MGVTEREAGVDVIFGRYREDRYKDDNEQSNLAPTCKDGARWTILDTGLPAWPGDLGEILLDGNFLGTSLYAV